MELPKLTDAQKTIIIAAACVAPVAIAEFRGQSPEIVAYIEKEGGRKRFIPKHNLALEFVGTGDQLPCEYYVPRTEAVPKDQDQREPALPEMLNVKKGELVLVEISGYLTKAGVTTCRISRLYPLADAGRTLRSNDGELPETMREYVLKTKAPSA